MSEQKLEPKLDQVEIKQTRTKLDPISFKNGAINKINSSQYYFGNKNFLFIPFKVSKDSHQRGLKLKIFREYSKETWTESPYPTSKILSYLW